MGLTDQSTPLSEVVRDRLQAADMVINDGGTQGRPLPPHHTHPCQPQPSLTHLYFLAPALQPCPQWGLTPRAGGETPRGLQHWLQTPGFVLHMFHTLLVMLPTNSKCERWRTIQQKKLPSRPGQARQAIQIDTIKHNMFQFYIVCRAVSCT